MNRIPAQTIGTQSTGEVRRIRNTVTRPAKRRVTDSPSTIDKTVATIGNSASGVSYRGPGGRTPKMKLSGAHRNIPSAALFWGPSLSAVDRLDRGDLDAKARKGRHRCADCRCAAGSRSRRGRAGSARRGRLPATGVSRASSEPSASRRRDSPARRPSRRANRRARRAPPP